MVTVPNILNEPILSFAPGSKERNDVIEVTITIVTYVLPLAMYTDHKVAPSVSDILVGYNIHIA